MEFLGKERLVEIFTSKYKELESIEFDYHSFVLDEYKELYQETICYIKDGFLCVFSRERTFFGTIYRFSRRQINIVADFHQTPVYELKSFLLFGADLVPCTYTGDVLEEQEEYGI